MLSDEGWMADGRWQMADGRWQMADGRWQMADGLSIPCRQPASRRSREMRVR